jgi:Mg-chelatase subunit ChlD
MMDNYKGKFGELKKTIGSFKIHQDAEVELIIQPPEGFEKVIKPIKMKVPPDEPTPTKKIPKNREIPSLPDSPPPLWFLKKLKSIFKDNTLERHAGNKRDGDLDCKHLYKAFTTGRCFTDKDIISKKVYNVALVVDCSGSMGGEQARIAASCMKHFIEQFQDIVQLSVILFNKKTEVVKLPHIKFKEPDFNKFTKIVINKPQTEDGGGNHDPFALRKAEEIMKPYKGRKIITMISDCEPACDCPSKECYHKLPGGGVDTFKELRNTVHEIESRHIPVLGLSILRDNVHDFYKEGAVLEEVSEMYPALIELIGRAVKRGRI